MLKSFSKKESEIEPMGTEERHGSIEVGCLMLIETEYREDQ